MAKKKRPVAKCASCNKNSWSAEIVDQKCKDIVNGRKCPGVFQRMSRDSDWIECRDCNATGTRDSDVCIPCGGDGWILIRIG